MIIEVDNVNQAKSHVVNVDGHDLGASDISEIIPSRFLLKNWVLNMCHVCFWEYDIPTRVTWPGWRCRRRWSWLGGLWHIWDNSQSTSLEKLDIKRVSYMFLIILMNSLSCFHWLSSSTSMGVSMTPNRVETNFSGYNTVPRASPENFISLS